MITTSFDSRPVYGGLVLDPRAKSHLVLAEGEGAPAVLKAFETARASLPRTVLIYTAAEGCDGGPAEDLSGLGAGEFREAANRAELLAALDEILATTTMGSRLYVAGAESFIGEVIAKAASHGVVPESVIAERRGSITRRVQCVHCKHVAEDVSVTPYECPGCGQSLLVRDHYSRRLAAFQGVRIDAEIPGEKPAAEELVH